MEYEWIDTWLGAPRFQRYVEQCEGNRGQALKLYEWNSLAGQMLMRDISHFEIALRNGYDKEISSSWEGEHHWLLDPHSPAITPVWRVREKNGVKRGQDVNQRNRKQVDDAISKCGNAKATAGQVMAELSFGFWRQFTTKAMEKTLWVPYINKCFPRHTQRSEVDKTIESVNSLRNRIAHNEPIYKRNGPDPFVIHSLMFGLLHDLSPEACKHAEETSGVQEIKNAKPIRTEFI